MNNSDLFEFKKMKFALIIGLVFLSLYIISCKRALKIDSIPENALLVDVRTKMEYKSGAVPNSINIPLSEVAKSIDQFKNQDNIVVFCRSGNRSGKAKAILDSLGIQNVVNGGSWKDVRNLTNAK